MFCPEGYMTIPEVRCLVGAFSHSQDANSNFTRSDAFESFVLNTITENDALRMCLPNGTILKVGSEILDRVLVSDVLPNETPPAIQFGDSRNPEETSEKRWASMPLFFVRPYYIVSLENYRALKTAAVNAFPKDYSADDIWAATALPFELDPLWGVLGKFEGASLCAIMDRMPKIILQSSSEELGSKTTLKAGRPSKLPQVRRAYEKVYPNGHGADTWKEVANNLADTSGVTVHVDTIKRALGLK